MPCSNSICMLSIRSFILSIPIIMLSIEFVNIVFFSVSSANFRCRILFSTCFTLFSCFSWYKLSCTSATLDTIIASWCLSVRVFFLSVSVCVHPPWKVNRKLDKWLAYSPHIIFVFTRTTAKSLRKPKTQYLILQQKYVARSYRYNFSGDSFSDF